jgi:hypothetical protein
MYACGSSEVQAEPSQAHCVLPDVLAPFRQRLDAPVREERLAIQAAPAMEAGLVSPAPVVVDTFPRAPGSPRVNEAATLSKAPKQSSHASRPSPRHAPPQGPRSRCTRTNASTTSSS